MRHVNTCKGNLGSSDGSAGGSIKAGSIGKGATGMRSSTSGSGRGGSRSASGSAIGGGKVSTTPAGSKSSGGDGGGSAAQGSAGSSGPFSFSKPRALICYLCGRGFGSASLPIHIPQCEQIFQERESTKPRGEPRRALQLRPARIAHIGSGTCTFPKDAAGIDAFNEEMFQTFNCSALVPCQHCGRTFLPEALAHHAKHCTEDAPMVRSGGGGGGGLGAAGSAGVGGSCLSMPDGAIIRSGDAGKQCVGELIKCSNCGRSFLPAAHAVHERVCAKVFGGGKKKPAK